jgi:hypothetical protein
LKIYLLRDDEGRHVFYADPPARRKRSSSPDQRGLRHWAERKANAIKDAWTHADRGFAGWARRGWEWLSRRTPADESMLVHLRTVEAIEIHHPAGVATEEVRVLWTDYLVRCKRRHLPGLGLNALVAPLTIVLAPLPGPNLVGYWFTYRAVRHFGALLGLRRAGSEAVAVTFHPVRELDLPAGGAVLAMPRDLSPARVGEFLRRSGQGAWS